MDICRNFITEKTSGFIDGIVDFMLKEPLIELKETQVPKIYVAFSNCILNIRTGEILPNSPNLICLYAINAEYIPNCNLLCPVFDKYLNDITGGDAPLIETIWQFIGYILTPDTAAKKFFLLQGVQNSGKSVLCKIIEKLFSPNAIVPLDAHSFGEDFVASELADKILCLCPDLPNEPLNAKSTSIIKQFTGNDSVSSKVKFKKNVTITTPAKFVLATNHPLITKSPDEAFFERIVTIPFKYSVPRESRNFNLIEEALNERNSIVTKAIFAYFRLVKNRYCFASEFPPNKVVMHCEECNETVLIKIYKFVRYNFQKSEKNYIFTDDIYNEFITKYGYVSLNEFSQIFIRFSEEAYGAKKIRKRRNNQGNPISAIQGIALKNNNL